MNLIRMRCIQTVTILSYTLFIKGKYYYRHHDYTLYYREYIPEIDSKSDINTNSYSITKQEELRYFVPAKEINLSKNIMIL